MQLILDRLDSATSQRILNGWTPRHNGFSPLLQQISFSTFKMLIVPSAIDIYTIIQSNFHTANFYTEKFGVQKK